MDAIASNRKFNYVFIILFCRYFQMDISGVQTAAIASSVGQNDAVGIAVLKKAMAIQEQSALQLIESIPQPQGNVGQNIDIKT